MVVGRQVRTYTKTTLTKLRKLILQVLNIALEQQVQIQENKPFQIDEFPVINWSQEKQIIGIFCTKNILLLPCGINMLF